MSGDGDFIETKDQIEHQCICPQENKDWCKQALDLLKNWLFEQADDVLSNIKDA